jgi:hypothetical protein
MAARHRVGEQPLELPHLVAAVDVAGPVVALDPEIADARVAPEVPERMDRRRQERRDLTVVAAILYRGVKPSIGAGRARNGAGEEER